MDDQPEGETYRGRDRDDAHLRCMRSLALNQLPGPCAKQRSYSAGKEVDGGPVVRVRVPEHKNVDDGPNVCLLGQKRPLRSRESNKQRPIANENRRCNKSLPAKPQLHDQVAKKISNPDLRQHVNELKAQLPAPN